MFQTAQIDLTKLWTITKQHPELVKTISFKDGTEHKMFNLTIRSTNFPDEYKTEEILANPKDVRPANKDEWKYWTIGSTKLWEDKPETSAPNATTAVPQPVADEEPPF